MSASTTPPTDRLIYLDAVRGISAVLLVIFHTGLIFTPFFEYLLFNPNKSLDLSLFAVGLLHPWQMPMLFFLAGITAHFSLRKRTLRQYLGERFTRLLIPFLFGLVVLIPPQVYLDLISRGFYDGSLIEFYPFYFTKGFTTGLFTWHHLWFILYLLVISLIAMPALAALRTESSRRWVSRLADVISRWGVIAVGSLPLMLSETLLRARFPGMFYNLYTDWANVSLFLILFVYGAIAASEPRIIQAFYRPWKAALLLAGVFTTTLLIAMKVIGHPPRLGYSDALYYLYTPVMALNTWCWLIGLIGLAHALIHRTSPLIDFATRRFYPFYILHQTILIAIGFYVLQLQHQLHLPVLVSFTLIVTLTFALTALAAELACRLPLGASLLGCKPTDRPVTANQQFLIKR